MKWNCPHCRTQLGAADNQITSSWSFALCAHCSRFGLVRKSFPHAVKVDRAPPGECVIRAAMTGPAPIIKPALPRKQATPQERRVLEARLPEPLPEAPDRSRFFPSGFVFFGCAALLLLSAHRHHRMNSAALSDTSSDTIVANAMAPEQIEAGSTIAPRSLNVLIRNNPGHQFPVIGALDPGLHYKVLAVQSETDGQWYRIDAGTTSPAWVAIQDVSPAN